MNFRFTESNLQELIFETNLPDEFKTVEAFGERQHRLSHWLGDAEMRELWFEGIHLNYGEMNLKHSISVDLANDTPLLEMHFNLFGSSFMDTDHFKQQPFSFSSRQHNVVYTPSFEGRIQMDKHNSPNKIFEVHLTEKYFQRLANQESGLFMDMAESMNKKQIAFMGEQNHPITARMNALIFDMMHCEKKGTLKRLFIESKVLELLMLQVEQFEQSKISVKRRNVNTYDLEKLHHAKFLIENNLTTPYSLIELAREVGLNEFKLKKEFKGQFKTTVFGYLYDLRMEQARNSLLDTGKSITEISEEVGYKNSHHFTVAFKKRYGVLPSHVRK